MVSILFLGLMVSILFFFGKKENKIYIDWLVMIFISREYEASVDDVSPTNMDCRTGEWILFISTFVLPWYVY